MLKFVRTESALILGFVVTALAYGPGSDLFAGEFGLPLFMALFVLIFIVMLLLSFSAVRHADHPLQTRRMVPPPRSANVDAPHDRPPLRTPSCQQKRPTRLLVNPLQAILAGSLEAERNRRDYQGTRIHRARSREAQEGLPRVL